MAYDFAHGNGTEESPFEVWTAEDLDGVRDHSGSYFVQKAHIDLESWGYWSPIAIGTWNNDFECVYDGQGFEIRNLTCNDNESNWACGLFGQVGDMVLEDIHLVNISCTGSGYVAGLISYTTGETTIKKCSVSGTLIGEDDCGGLVGSLWNGPHVIEDCHTHGSITGDTNGGLIGSVTQNTDTAIRRCFSTMDVQGPERLGGLFGTVMSTSDGSVLIEECSAHGTVTSAGNTVGGFISYCNYPVIKNCYASGAVEGNQRVGGFIGRIGWGTTSATLERDGATFEHCYARGSVTGNDLIGGFAGIDDPTKHQSTEPLPTIIDHCFYDSAEAGVSHNNVATPKTTAEMKTQATFTDWNFDDIWAIDSHE